MDIDGVVDQLSSIANRLRDGEDVGFAEDSAAIETAVGYLPLLAHALWILLDGREVAVRASPDRHALSFSVPEPGCILVRRAALRTSTVSA